MKKAMVYILALTMLFTVMLSGCGENRGNGNNGGTDPKNTDILPEVSMPVVEDGEVEDTDGIITDDDNGTGTVTGGDTGMGNNGGNGTGNTGAGNGNGNGGNGTTGGNGNTGGMSTGDNSMDNGLGGGTNMP